MVKTTETSVDARIGANIAAARKAAELSQAALAKKLTEISGLEWNERLIARLESGDRPLRYSEAVSLAQALEIPVSQFFDGGAGEIGRTAEIGRVGRAMKRLARAGTTSDEFMWELFNAQEEFIRAVAAVDPARLREVWSEDAITVFYGTQARVWHDIQEHVERGLAALPEEQVQRMMDAIETAKRHRDTAQKALEKGGDA